jgi:hypothetical protein
MTKLATKMIAYFEEVISQLPCLPTPNFGESNGSQLDGRLYWPCGFILKVVLFKLYHQYIPQKRLNFLEHYAKFAIALVLTFDSAVSTRKA